MCQKTCWNWWRNLQCQQQCVRGCFCYPGFVRNQYWQCVPIRYCYWG
ncbi:hypothetical protein B4U80_02376 [Leptotrombidium deliense]|uniref:TIL domain-containing protein n=1 Tax=Leptotrombidium deliense TaxID=299467 RepID=A0A443S5A0_9ACAR|nr:hypothetical protein B4U80_02376 [Leptotrombidium deliense]